MTAHAGMGVTSRTFSPQKLIKEDKEEEEGRGFIFILLCDSPEGFLIRRAEEEDGAELGRGAHYINSLVLHWKLLSERRLISELYLERGLHHHGQAG